MRKAFVVFSIVFFCFHVVSAQSKSVDTKEFFQDDHVVRVNLSMDIKNLLAAKRDTNAVPANIVLKFPDSTVARQEIRLKPKGVFRRENCYMASMQVDFKSSPGNFMSPLKKLKLIGGCGKNSSDEQLVYKEYLVYKLYNLFTDLSFRVRLADVTYEDTRGKMKSYTQHAFFIEDIDELAKRNHCKQKEQTLQTEQTDRKQMTLVAFFQFMVGNTDWSVPTFHNIKLVASKKDSLANPFVVPFDFDYTGFVNASYATPPEMFETTKITERVYRGFPRTTEEVDEMRNIFLAKESQVKALIADFALLDPKERKQALNYIDEFYDIAKNPKKCQYEFIDKARKK